MTERWKSFWLAPAWSYLAYTLKKWETWLGILLVSSLVVLLFWKGDWTRDLLFGHVLDPFFGILTAIFALMAALITHRQAWKDKLEKRLNVHFVLGGKTNGKVVMVCREASLVHEGDIRNWAQQIGRQWGGQLPLEPVIDLDPPRIHQDENGPYFLHSVFLFLSSYPTEKKPMPPDPKKFHLWERRETKEKVVIDKSLFSAFPNFSEVKANGIDHWLKHQNHDSTPN